MGTLALISDKQFHHQLYKFRHNAFKSGRRYMIAVPQNPPFTATVKTTIPTYETKPYDGMVIDWKAVDVVQGLVSGSINSTTSNPLYWPSLAQALDDLNTTNFNKFQRNFLKDTLQTSGTLGTPPLDGMDPNYEVVIQKRRLLARLCFRAGITGIWDNLEPTNGTVGRKFFNYSDRPGASFYSFEQYCNRYRQIGRRRMEVMLEEYPHITWLPTFLYEQAATQLNLDEEERDYGLLPSYLDGHFDALVYPGKVNNWYEAGYNRNGDKGEHQRWQQDNLISDNDVDFSGYIKTDRYEVFTGNAIMVDYPASAVWDGTPPYTNVHTPALFQQGLEVGAKTTSEEYQSVYGEDVSPLVLPIEYDNAARAARITVGMDYANAIDTNPDVIFRLRPLSLTGMVDGASISSVTDLKGNVGTSSGGLRPTWSANAFGTGKPGIHYTGASSQKLIWDAVGALLFAAATADAAYTIIACINPVSVTAGTACIASFGHSVTDTCIISLQTNGNGDLATQRQDSAGSSPVCPAVAGTAIITVIPQIVAVVSTGLGASLFSNNNLLLAAPLAQDVGAMTLDQFTTGAKRSHAVLQNFFNGDISDMVIVKGALGVGSLRSLNQVIAIDNGITLTA